MKALIGTGRKPFNQELRNLSQYCIDWTGTRSQRTEQDLITSNQRDGEEVRMRANLGEIKSREGHLPTQLRKHPCQTDDSSEKQERQRESHFIL